MKNFSKPQHRHFSDKKSFSDRNSGSVFKAVCSQCAADCEVPFKPSGDRPVLCSNCFRRPDSSPARYGSSSRNEREPRFERENRFDRRQNRDSGDVTLATINKKLDKILQILGEFEED